MTEGSRQEAADRPGRRRKDRSRDAIAPLRPPSKSRGPTLGDVDRALLDSMAEGFALHEILYDAEGRPCDYRFLEVNPAFERQTGLRATDLVGRTVREVIPDIEPMWIERYGRVALTGKPDRFEAPSASLGRRYEVRAYQAGTGRFAAVFTDVTDRIRAEESLREANERLRIQNEQIQSQREELQSQAVKLTRLNKELEQRAQTRTAELASANEELRMEVVERRRAEADVRAERHRFKDVLDQMPGYLVLLAPDYHVTFANRFFEERFGKAGGRCCYEYLFHRSTPCEVCETYTVLKTHAPHRWEWTGPDGRRYDVYDYPFQDADGSTLIMEVGLDVTEIKRTEAELGLHRQRLEELVKERTAELEATNARLQAEIAERQEAQENLRATALFPDQNPSPVLRVSRDGFLLFANAASKRLLRSWHCKTGHVVPDAVREKIRQAMENSQVGEMEVTCGRVTYAFSVAPIASQGYANLYAHDITRRKAAEEAVRWSARRDELLSNTAAHLLQSGTPQALIEDLCRQVMDFLDCQIFFNFLVDEQAGRLRLNACAGISEERASQIEWLDYGAAVCGRVAQDRRRIIVEDVLNATDPHAELIKSYGIQAYCCHPLKVQNRLIGTLSFGTRSRTRFSPEHIAVMKEVADLVAVAMQRIETETALRRSQEDLDRAQTVGQIGSWRIDIQRNILSWSDESYRIFGMHPGTSMTYEAFLAAVHPADRPYVDMAWQRALRGEPYDIEHRIVVGEQVTWVRERASLEFDEEGALLGGFGIVQDITERKRTEQILQENEQRLRLALEGGRMGLWEWDVQNECSFWDDRVYELIGADPQKAPGAAVFFERVYPADRERLQVQMQDVLATAGDFQVEFRVVRPDQKTAWLASRGRVVRNEQNQGVRLLGVLYDVTQRKEMEAELRRLNDQLEEEVRAQTEELGNTVSRLEEEVARRRLAEKNLRERSQLLEGFFRHTITPLAFMDRRFNFVQVNDAYAKADDREPKHFIGQNHFAMYPNAENQAIFEEVVRTKQPYHALAKPFQFAEHPERGVSYWNWQLTPLLDDAGEVQFLVLNLQDVTARQEAMRELEKRTSQLQRLTAELSEAEDRERRRLAELLHDDLQQLLVGSKLRLNILARKLKGAPEACELVDETTSLIAESIHKSRGLSHELSPPVLHHGDLREVLQWLIEQIHTTCGLKIRLWVGPGVDLRSQTLKTFVYKAVRELLFNVVKHANVRRAAIVVQRQEQSIRLAVLDKGRGFEAERLDVAGQNGFGLFNIRERVQFLGGLLTVQSVPGRGSRFVLTIPLSVPDETTSQKTGAPILSIPFRPATQPARDTPAAKLRFRILLVDDHKVMRDGLAALLEEEPDIEVVGQAGNGRDAITLTGQLKPDVVVMDVVMPIIDGEEATRQIRAQWPRVRVVALSMLEEDTTRERMLKAGAEVFLSKAGPSEVIAAAIRRSS